MNYTTNFVSYGLDNTFHLISKSVGYVTPNNLLDSCRSIGMMELPAVENRMRFVDLLLPLNFPAYDTGYYFKYKTNNDINAIIEILEKDNKILQAGAFMVYPPSIFFSRLRNHYRKLQNLIESYYGAGTTTTLGKIDMINFGDSKTVCYLSKGRANDREYISFKIGDRIFWD